MYYTVDMCAEPICLCCLGSLLCDGSPSKLCRQTAGAQACDLQFPAERNAVDCQCVRLTAYLLPSDCQCKLVGLPTCSPLTANAFVRLPTCFRLTANASPSDRQCVRLTACLLVAVQLPMQVRLTAYLLPADCQCVRLTAYLLPSANASPSDCLLAAV